MMFRLVARSFLSTLSLRRATGENLINGIRLVFLSTLSLRRATRRASRQQPAGEISIHALLAESDNPSCLLISVLLIFLSTLSLRRATLGYVRGCFFCVFLSTLSLRRATLGNVGAGSRMLNFYPRSPCGERQPRKTDVPGAIVFLSTLSLRRATLWVM